MKTEKVKITEIQGNKSNPRIIKDDKFKKLVKSIKEFPQMLEIRPIVVDEQNVVLGGNMRLKACIQAGLKEVFIIRANELTDEQKKEFIIKDNVGFGEWDWDQLANEWDTENLEQWGLDLPIDLRVEELEAEEDDYNVPDGGIETNIVIGDLFEIGEHRLLCGDSTDSDQVAKLMNSQKADMVLTDPPYGMNLDADYSSMKGEGMTGTVYDKVIGDNDDFTPELINTIFACFNEVKEIFIFGADYFAELIPNKNEGSWIVWDKRESEETGKNVDMRFGSMFELCWSKQKHKRLIARIMWAGMMGVKDDSKRFHPTQKPTQLAKWFLNQWSKENDLIVDLFLGSGSTMIASHQLNRKCFGMELDPKYCQSIINRIKKLDPNLIIKRNGEII